VILPSGMAVRLFCCVPKHERRDISVWEHVQQTQAAEEQTSDSNAEVFVSLVAGRQMILS
jgi:hypothetical protein